MPRSNPAGSPLNDTQIVLMGGWNRAEYFSDVQVFDIKAEKPQQMVIKDAYKFQAWGNQCAQLGMNRVIALVRGEDFAPSVIEWKQGTSAVNVLYRLPN